jgi:hypothetical protein
MCASNCSIFCLACSMASGRTQSHLVIGSPIHFTRYSFLPRRMRTSRTSATLLASSSDRIPAGIGLWKVSGVLGALTRCLMLITGHIFQSDGISTRHALLPTISVTKKGPTHWGLNVGAWMPEAVYPDSLRLAKLMNTRSPLRMSEERRSLSYARPPW